MKVNIFKAIAITLTALVALASCDTLNTISKPGMTSQGSPYEVYVVCNQAEWNTANLGKRVDSLLSEDVPHIYRQEPQFKVFHIPFSSYKDLIAKHRNIITIEINPAFKEPKMIVMNNMQATPQVVINIKASSSATAKEFFTEKFADIAARLEYEERIRDVTYATNYNEPSINQLIKNKFGIVMNVPKGYTVRQDSKDFLWASYETELTSQGFMLYTYPADGEIDSESVLAARNEWIQRVPGPSDGSVMTTSDAVPNIFTPMVINGRTWYEQRGLWCVTNDFMGGPYVSYSTLDNVSNSVLVLDCYVYSPKKELRNLLREVEHLIYGVEVPSALQVSK